ncbi:MAG: carbon-nitrogen hydrolase, partial [Zavarzinia sp.]|nr:carbon-nitrogen hydrolase [Zavarzinia sp.]
MRIAVFQGPRGARGKAAVIARLDTAAEEAAAQGARLLVAPEMILSGYNIGRDAALAAAEDPDGPSARAISDIARRHGIAIAYGYPERGAGDTVYNAAQVIERDGTRLANHRKCHLFGALDQAMFTAGEALAPL